MLEERVIQLENTIRQWGLLPPIRDAILAEKERIAAEAKAAADKAEADAKAKEPVKEPGPGDNDQPPAWKEEPMWAPPTGGPAPAPAFTPKGRV
jgi:hypothetical protein